MKMQTFFELLAQFNGVFFLFLGFTLKGELLFFACTKKTNEKKVHPGRMVAARLPSSFVAWWHWFDGSS